MLAVKRGGTATSSSRETITSKHRQQPEDNTPARNSRRGRRDSCCNRPKQKQGRETKLVCWFSREDGDDKAGSNSYTKKDEMMLMMMMVQEGGDGAGYSRRRRRWTLTKEEGELKHTQGRERHT